MRRSMRWRSAGFGAVRGIRRPTPTTCASTTFASAGGKTRSHRTGKGRDAPVAAPCRSKVRLAGPRARRLYGIHTAHPDRPTVFCNSVFSDGANPNGTMRLPLLIPLRPDVNRLRSDPDHDAFALWVLSSS